MEGRRGISTSPSVIMTTTVGFNFFSAAARDNGSRILLFNGPATLAPVLKVILEIISVRSDSVATLS
jgi:hypothetical protein